MKSFWILLFDHVCVNINIFFHLLSVLKGLVFWMSGYLSFDCMNLSTLSPIGTGHFSPSILFLCDFANSA
jgi:hypothetical protein